MEYIDPKSSQARKVGYDPERKLLEVHFRSGGVYHYEPVWPAQYEALMQAESWGSHFHRHIKKNDAIKYRKADPQ